MINNGVNFLGSEYISNRKNYGKQTVMPFVYMAKDGIKLNKRIIKAENGFQLGQYEQYQAPESTENNSLNSLFDIDYGDPVRFKTPDAPKEDNTSNKEVFDLNSLYSEAKANPKSTGVLNRDYSKWGKDYEQFKKDMDTNLSGIDDDERNFLTYVAANESGFKDAKNPNSTARGRFQMVDGTWNSNGGGERNTANDFRNMHNLYKSYNASYDTNLDNWAKSNNYAKSSVLSLMHSLGVGGAKLYASQKWNSWKDFNDAYNKKFKLNTTLDEKLYNNILNGRMYSGV